MYFDTLILHLRHALLFQQLVLSVRDWYEQCGYVYVGAWAKQAVCQQPIRNVEKSKSEITNRSLKN